MQVRKATQDASERSKPARTLFRSWRSQPLPLRRASWKRSAPDQRPSRRTSVA